MKFALSLALVTYLMSSAFPVAAQEKTEAVGSFTIRADANVIIPDAIGRAAEPLGQPRSPNVARSGGGVAKGALIGFGIGAVLGATVGQEACLHSPRWHCAVGGGAMFAAIGAGIAWLRK